MRRKNLGDIYSRNVVGLIKSSVAEINQLTLLWFPTLIVLMFTLPFTLTFGAGIKSLVDFFSRKEIAEEKMSNLNSQIDQSNEEEISALVNDICIYNAQSISSIKLIQSLQTASKEAQQEIGTAIKTKRKLLQKEQFNPEGVAELVMDVDVAISNVKLNPKRQTELNNYATSASGSCHKQKLEKQKAIIKQYLDAEHNSGKKMQHIIYNHFFFIPEESPSNTPIVAPSVNP